MLPILGTHSFGLVFCSVGLPLRLLRYYKKSGSNSAYDISLIVYSFGPAGDANVTVSPFFVPMSTCPRGDS